MNNTAERIDPNKVKQILGKHILADGYDIIMDYEQSHGSWIVDQRTGEEYLDMFAMFGSSTVGYNHPYILEKQAWLGKHATYRPTLSDIYYEEYAEFMKVFERVIIPKELPYCFFIDGGALAVENALKTAFDWKTRKNWLKGSKTEGSKVIHFEQAFHGRSGYTLSLTNTFDPRKYQYFPLFKWPRIVNPKLHFPLTDESLAHTKALESKALLHIEEVILAQPEEIACIIIEPVQSEGGHNHFRKEFLQKLREICDQHDILLIFDEVQTGIGMSGSMFAYQEIGVVPDIVAFGKKTQICGILANKEKLDQVEHHVFKESSRLNSTFGGNFIDMLRLKLICEIIEKENLVENARNLGLFLVEGLQKLEAKHSSILSNARGLGLLCAIDFPTTELRNEAIKRILKEEKVFMLACGEKTLRFRSQLNVTQDELSQALQAIDHVVSKM